MEMKRVLLSLLPAAIPLAGCASFSGMPDPVLDVNAAVNTARLYDIDTALKAYHLLGDVQRREYRNRVIAIHLAAGDMRYAEFRADLSRQVKGANLGLDMAVLGLTGIGAVANGAANELSAGAAALTGTRAAINKELYFEKTLPALIASMDANRLKIKSTIVERLGLPASEYPLEQAFSDLIAYQMAASIDSAIQNVTTAAAEEVEEQQRNYDNITVTACDSPAGLRPLWLRINNGVRGLNQNNPADAESTAKIAALMGLEPAELFDHARRGTKLNEQFCTMESATALIQAINTQTGRTF